MGTFSINFITFLFYLLKNNRGLVGRGKIGIINLLSLLFSFLLSPPYLFILLQGKAFLIHVSPFFFTLSSTNQFVFRTMDQKLEDRSSCLCSFLTLTFVRMWEFYWTWNCTISTLFMCKVSLWGLFTILVELTRS